MEPFLGEIKIFTGTYAPQGWAFCDGSSLSISTNDALYSLIGTTYGGDGVSTFNLPDLRGRIPVHFNLGTFLLGQMGGTESVTLNATQIAAHSHTLYGDTTTANDQNPKGNLLAQPSTFSPYASGSPNVSMASTAISPVIGPAQPHENVQPFLCINYIIALQGVFPSQN